MVNQTRSFCYVDDMIDGLVKLMNTPHEVTGPINLGNTREITILELAGMIIRLTGSKSGIIHKELPKDDPAASATRYYEGRGHSRWVPSTTLETGIEKTIDFFDRLLNTEHISPLSSGAG